MTSKSVRPVRQPGESTHVVWAIIALAAGGFGIGTTEFAIMGLLQDVAEGLQISIPQSGQLISAYALGVVVGAPILAALGARVPHKYMVLGLMGLFTIGNLSSVVAADYTTMLLTRFLSGLPHGAYFGVAAVIAASLVAPAKRAQAVAAVMLGLSVANVVGVPLVTWLGQQYGWRLMFVAVGIMGVITLVLLQRFVPFTPTHAEASIRKELSALKRIQVWLALLIGIVGFGGFFAVYSYISPTMTDVTGVPESALPLIVGLYGLGMVAGNLIGGRLADRSVMGSIYIVMTAIIIVLVLFWAAAGIPWLAIPLVFLLGAAGSSLIPGLQTRLMDASPDAQTLAASLNHSALNMANALGAFLGGAVIAAGWGFKAPALVGAGLAFLGLAVAAISGLLDRRGQAPVASEAADALSARKISGSK
ncbi:MFS transporter [Arthrobacter crystallopoietes]|jgi:MFS transporter, DHA1 family, inner membrane transport protein|uniref:MFS transporter, DHA1 family, arabinose polymer transporter n=1 Tax=Crystallibacter crystallopoietes TaxID=37928 RepID=A0A1H1H1Q8_9MICC|nr:MFS transporter [Arthrobacter crystallopoietes]AUI52215.1 arabinose ABC transporter permease [Arthrobacter crystallopoietes]SDR19319.1 MFS transporter, DHA1 family, arabinose polymer transporter [Arthrobacter crystallopoietes]